MSSVSQEATYKQAIQNEVMLNSKVYYLNKSRTKYLNVGWSPNSESIMIKLYGSRSFQCVCYSEAEWCSFLSKHDVLIRNFNVRDQPETIWDFCKTYRFEYIQGEPVLKIYDSVCDGEVYLGKVTIFTIINCTQLVNEHIQQMKKMDILYHYNAMLTSYGKTVSSAESLKAIIKESVGDFQVYFTLLEYIFLYPAKIESNLKDRRSNKMDINKENIF